MGGGLLDEGDLDMARVTGAVKWRHLTAQGEFALLAIAPKTKELGR